MSDLWGELSAEGDQRSSDTDSNDLTNLSDWDFPDDEEPSPKSRNNKTTMDTGAGLPDWDQLRDHIDHGAALSASGKSSPVRPELHVHQLQEALSTEKRKVRELQDRLERESASAMRTQLDFLREQLASERKQREGAVARANGIRDSMDRSKKEAKSLSKLLAREQAITRRLKEAASGSDETARVQKDLEDERAQHEQHKDEAAKLRAELGECRSRLAAAEAENVRLRAEMDSPQRAALSPRSPRSPLSPRSRSGSSPRSPSSKDLDDGSVTSASLQQQFNELTEAIMRIPVRQRGAGVGA